MILPSFIDFKTLNNFNETFLSFFYKNESILFIQNFAKFLLNNKFSTSLHFCACALFCFVLFYVTYKLYYLRVGLLYNFKCFKNVYVV